MSFDPRFSILMITKVSVEAKGLPSGSERDLRERLHDVGVLAVDLAHQFRVRRLPQDDGVVGRAGLDHRVFDAAREHEDGGEDERHERQAGQGQCCRQPACPEAPPCVGKGYLHGLSDGTQPLGDAGPEGADGGEECSDDAGQSGHDRCEDDRDGLDVEHREERREHLCERSGDRERQQQARAPRRSPAISSDSPPISPMMCPGEKPMVLSTAYSVVRSRAAMTIVFASTSRMMPMMMKETISSERMMALDIETNPCWNSRSVSVFVPARTVQILVVHGPRDGRHLRRICRDHEHIPSDLAVAARLNLAIRSSRYFQWKNIWVSSVLLSRPV